MQRRLPFAWAMAAAFLLASSLTAQNPTGTLTGTVHSSDGTGLPGVKVTATSPNLQGERSTFTGSNGAYKLGFLPAGLYEIDYELEGFNTVVREVKLNAAQTAISDVDLSISAVAEEIVVQGNLATISETPTIATTIGQNELESLAVTRDITEAVDLVPGVHRTGPVQSGEREGQVSISGAMSFENLWLINGVVVNENLRGQPLDLFIEDAVQETTAMTGNVSAEYGRFSGGVVSVLTKSGGNAFNGSLRVNLENEDWESRTPLTAQNQDKVNEVFEGTFGGRIIRDRLWFFLAGRDRERDELLTLTQTNIPVNQIDMQERYEGKLTLNVTASHSLVGSYLEIDQFATNQEFGDPLEARSLSDRGDPQELWSLHYSGVFGSNIFLEAQHSEREFEIGQGSGGPRDLILGSPWETVLTGDSRRWGAPAFCGECEQELRNNENSLVKGSYFLSTESVGTHDISFGYDTFSDIAFDVNHQSGSDFRLASDDVLIDPNSGEVFPVLDPAGSSWVGVWPVFGLDRVEKTDFATDSFFVNDRWQLSDKWSFNLGVRFDENDGTNAGGLKVADDSKVSPRLGVTYDLEGDGDLVINASVGSYVAAVANNLADSTSNGGAIGRAILFWGDLPGAVPINTDPGCVARGDCVSTLEATQLMVDAWLAGTGFNPLTDAPEGIAGIPGVQFLLFPGTESNRAIPDTIKSPSADEVTLGATKRLGARGLLRADIVYRDWTDFYSDRVTLETGQVSVEGNLFDFEEVGNFGNDKLSREYIGLHMQGRYRLGSRLTLAGSYALSELEGNINGETTQGGPISFDPNRYPEYKAFAQNNPVGDLGSDQRHKLRAWAVYDLLQGERQNLSVSVLQSYYSGTPYGVLGAVESIDFIDNPGYLSPDPNVGYYFTSRDAFTTEDITATDLALNYSFRWNAFGKAVEVFIQPEILNVFGEEGVLDVDTSVLDNTITSALQPFNPYTQTPQQGVNWNLGESFGQPLDENDFQTPRTFRFSVGFRF